MRSWVRRSHFPAAEPSYVIFGLRNYLSAAKEALPCWFAAGIICVSPLYMNKHDVLRHAFLAPFFSHTNGADNPAGMALYA